MDQNLENRIRERAYEIWTAHGCIHGQADQHWLTAEREILTELTVALAVKQNLQQQKGRFRAPSRSRKALTM
jgi:Protein of unknown function (DUF2934)